MSKVKNTFKNLFDSGTSTITADGVFEKGSNCVIENSDIKIGKKAKLYLGNNVHIRNFRIYLEEGELIIGDNTVLEQANNAMLPRIDISNGKLKIGTNNVIRADFSIRYGGNCTIGEYNCINENTEIRCDESLSIGDFNMISYQCMIYDTNSHVMYAPEKRREMTKKDFPNIGCEYEKPITKPVSIGSDCWLGKRAVVLKGSHIGNNSIVATCCVVTSDIPENSMAYGNPAQHKPKEK